MASSSQQDDICEIVQGVMRDFRESMEYSHQMSIRIGRRTTQIIRLGMLSVLILGIVMTYLITTLAADFSKMTEHMTAMSANITKMERHFAAVNGRIGNIDSHLTRMNESVFVLPGMADSLLSLNHNTFSMAGDMRSMVGDIDVMRTDVSSMSTSIETMDLSVGGMHNAVNHMTGSMYRLDGRLNKMSKPMDFYPFK